MPRKICKQYTDTPRVSGDAKRSGVAGSNTANGAGRREFSITFPGKDSLPLLTHSHSQAMLILGFIMVSRGSLGFLILSCCTYLILTFSHPRKRGSKSLLSKHYLPRKWHVFLLEKQWLPR